MVEPVVGPLGQAEVDVEAVDAVGAGVVGEVLACQSPVVLRLAGLGPEWLSVLDHCSPSVDTTHLFNSPSPWAKVHLWP